MEFNDIIHMWLLCLNALVAYLTLRCLTLPCAYAVELGNHSISLLAYAGVLFRMIPSPWL